MKRNVVVLVAAGLLSACSARPAQVPVSGPQQDLAALGGEWNGTYKTETGRVRTGHVFFNLRPGKDSAIGYVVMTYPVEPVTVDPYQYPSGVLQTEQLAISFVRALGGRVSGQLEEYADPYCGCKLRTTFVGRLRGDRIEGTFTSQHLASNVITWGEWRVSRTAPKVIVEN